MSYTTQLSGSTFHSGELYNTTEWWYFHSCELNNITEWWFFHSRELYNTTELTHELSDVRKLCTSLFTLSAARRVNIHRQCVAAIKSKIAARNNSAHDKFDRNGFPHIWKFRRQYLHIWAGGCREGERLFLRLREYRRESFSPDWVWFRSSNIVPRN